MGECIEMYINEDMDMLKGLARMGECIEIMYSVKCRTSGGSRPHGRVY